MLGQIVLNHDYCKNSGLFNVSFVFVFYFISHKYKVQLSIKHSLIVYNFVIYINNLLIYLRTA